MNIEKHMPSTTETFYQQGISLIAQQDFINALIAFDKALESEPDNIEYLEAKATSLLRLRQYDEALENILKVIELNETDSSSYYIASVIYLAKKDFVNSQNYLTDAMLLDPSSKETYYTQGVLMLQTNQYNEAVRYFDIATQKDPDNTPYHYAKGLSLLKLEKWQDAKQSFNNALAIDPNHHQAKKYLTDCESHLIGNDEVVQADYLPL